MINNKSIDRNHHQVYVTPETHHKAKIHLAKYYPTETMKSFVNRAVAYLIKVEEETIE